jgi:hypothetical protein
VGGQRTEDERGRVGLIYSKKKAILETIAFKRDFYVSYVELTLNMDRT